MNMPNDNYARGQIATCAQLALAIHQQIKDLTGKTPDEFDAKFSTLLNSLEEIESEFNRTFGNILAGYQYQRPSRIVLDVPLCQLIILMCEAYVPII